MGTDQSKHVYTPRFRPRAISMPETLREEYNQLCEDEKTQLNCKIQELQKIESPKIVVALMGPTNVGKSSLVHALMNLPKGANPEVGARTGVTRVGERFILEGQIEIC